MPEFEITPIEIDPEQRSFLEFRERLVRFLSLPGCVMVDRPSTLAQDKLIADHLTGPTGPFPALETPA